MSAVDAELIAGIFAEGGITLLVEPARRCWCWSQDTRQPRWDHAVCGGFGVIYGGVRFPEDSYAPLKFADTGEGILLSSPVKVKGLFRSQSRWISARMQGELDHGEASLTLPLGAKPHYEDRRVRDRITVLNATDDGASAFAFPLSPQLDDFAAPLDARWTAFYGGALTVTGGRLVNATGDWAGIYSTASYSGDAEVWTEGLQGGSDLYLHLDPVAGSTYYLYSDDAGSIQLHRIDPGGADTALWDSQHPVDDTGFGLQRKGSTLQAWHKTRERVWARIGPAITDVTYSHGHVAIDFSNGASVDDIGGGAPGQPAADAPLDVSVDHARVFYPTTPPVPFLLEDVHLGWRCQVTGIDQRDRVKPQP